MKRKLAIGAAVLAAVILISGASALTYAFTPGTQADPFITLSYLREVFRPQIMNEVRNIEQQMTQRFNARVNELEAQLQAGGGAGGGGQPATSTADRFHVVTLRRGQTLNCSVGAEIMLRVGTATGRGSAPALVNYTSGSTLSAGTALTPNNMYLVTIEGNGVTATADTVRILVRGTYQIS